MELVRYARIGILTGIFALPFIVLIVSSSMYFPFITGKNFAFRVIVEIIFALWVVLAVCCPEYRPKKSLALLIGAAFVAWVGIATLTAENPVKAFWSNFERMEGYITILHLSAYVLVLTTVMNTEKLWRNFFYTSLGAATIVGAYSVFQLLGAFTINQGGLRIDATFGNATYFAVYMLIHSFLALYAYARWSGESRWLKITFGTLFALYSILVFYSATRGSILGLLGGLVIAGGVVLFVRGAGTYARTAAIGGLIAVLVAVGGFYAIKNTEYVQNHPILSRIASISLESGSVRFAIWGMALDGAKERPLFGWGQEGFNYVFNKYYRPELVTQEPWFDRAHNVVLDWLVAGGIPAMLLYLALYAVLIYYLWRPSSQFEVSEKALLTGLLAAYGFHNLFVFDNLLSYVMFALVFSYIVWRTHGTRDATGVRYAEPEVAMPIALVALLVILYGANWPGYASATGIIQGLSPHSEGVTKNLEYFITASANHGLGHQEVGEQFIQFAVQVKGLNVGDQAFRVSVAQAARTAFDGVLLQAPHDARLLAFYGSFLRQFGDFPAARSAFTAALAESPQKQSVLLEKGMLDMAEQKYDEAVVDFGNIYATAPTYMRVHIYLASAALLAGKRDVANEIFKTHFESDEPEDLTISDAYLRIGEYSKALRIAQLVAEHDPRPETYQFLAGVYLQGKNRDAAIAVLEKAKALDPRYSQAADEYISQIRAGKI